ncbi:EH signature domain-containing protein [Orrella sp. 11846]|uniref:EH signature domain-containing protein n=1 Tax=Orrella sp. 11846 TaxID=3409913 RepID=UPI003B5CE4F1
MEKSETTISLSGRLDNLRPIYLPTPPSFEILERTIRRIMNRFDVSPVAPQNDSEELFAEMHQRIAKRDWHKVPMSFVTKVASLVFSAVHRLRDDLIEIRRFLYREIIASDRQGFLNPMMRIYVETYEIDAPHTKELARCLSQVKARIGARWQKLLINFPQLLDPVRAPEVISEWMMNTDNPWHNLRSRGLRQPHAPGLMDAAHLAFVQSMATQLDNQNEIEKLLSWLNPDQHTLRQNGAGVAINALLNVWIDQDPPQEIKALLIDRLTALYGHPRADRHAAWNEVSPKAEGVFLRWLMGADIRFLFQILTEVERGHMWTEREAFWWTLYEQGRIHEVWVAFNEAGYATAINKLPMDSQHGGRRFGKQIGEKDKSLLIMRIGELIVVEGTYSFQVHAFNAHNPETPKLYLEHYDVARIRKIRSVLWKQVHSGNWEDSVLRRL